MVLREEGVRGRGPSGVQPGYSFLNTTREWDNVVLVTGSGAVVWLFPNYL